MRIVFDHGTPATLRKFLTEHTVSTAYELGWARLKNGDLLAEAETGFDLIITKDQNIRYQQNLSGRKLAILVLPTTSWPKIKLHIEKVREAVVAMKLGEYRELHLSK